MLNGGIYNPYDQSLVLSEIKLRILQNYIITQTLKKLKIEQISLKNYLEK